MQLNKDQFKNFIPAAEEGRAAAAWLSTPAGHGWQTKKHERQASGNSVEGVFGMYGLKDDDSAIVTRADLAYSNSAHAHDDFWNI